MRAMHTPRALLSAAVCASFFSLVNAANFTFSYGAPTQCDNFPVSWTGGSPPFELQFVPEFGTARTFSISSDKFSNGKGSFEAQIPFAANHTFVAVMSDSSGYGSGGVSQLLKVGASVGSQSCNTTDPGVDFFFELNLALNQCRPYTFSNYVNATQPVTISAIIPGGQAFFINPTKGPTFFNWLADVSAGTSLLFTMTDAKGKTGGSSDVKLVGFSDDSSCLGSNSPSSLAAIPSSTARSAADSGSTGTAGGSNTGVIIGGVLAALFGIATIISLALFFLRRRRRRSGFYGSGGYPYGGNNRIDSGDLDAPVAMQDAQTQPVVQPYPYTPTTVHASQGTGSLNSHMSPSSHQLLPGQAPSQYSESRYDGRTQYTITNGAPSESMYSQNTHGGAQTEGSSAGPSSPVSSAARRKAAMAGHTSYQPPPRFIMHQDFEEAPPAEGDVVELPPQYSERRAPIPGLNDYTGPPPGAPGPSRAVNPLETEGGDGKRLQEPLSPSTPRSPPGSRRS